MNHVVIRYSYLSSKAEVIINGESASPYSELSTTLNRPFLESVNKIISGLDNEVFDDYDIDFYGTVFQYKLLMAGSEKSDFCKEIRFNDIESLIPKETLLNRLSIISNENKIVKDKPSTMLVYNLSNIIVPQSDAFICVDNPIADIGIFNVAKEIPATIRIPVIVAGTIRAQNLAGRTVLFIPEKDFDDFWEYIELEYVVRPSIIEYMTALRYVPLSPLQKVELESIKNGKPEYYIGDFPTTLDQGESAKIEFVSFPSDFFVIKSENPAILSCDKNILMANESGIASILIVDQKGEVVAQKQVSVIRHHYVEEIRLIPHFEYLKRNERNKIDVIITPLNAEDANRLIWNNSNPNVIRVDEDGNIYAIGDGQATITVSGYLTHATLRIEVKPALQGLRFTQQSVRIKSGETVIIDCEVTPPEAPAENLNWELDNKTIASINPSKDGRRCQVIASSSYEGKGNVRCYDSNTRLGAVCNIEVVSKVKQGAVGRIALWCWVLGIIMPFLLPVSGIVGIYGIACDPEPDHKTRYIVCTVGSILTLLFWLSM
ncbi:hypothetical protein ABXS75_18715 [Roseburia hominis]